jgi:hypothetical protein
VLPQRVGRLYEEGTIVAASAWTDEEPSPPPVSARTGRPAGYEMRWWAPNGDDIVADVLVFENPRSAERFAELAASPHCHPNAHHGPAPQPPHGRNLSWRNPDGVVQADIFMVRGSRVYRIADAPAGKRLADLARADGLTQTFFTIDTLACLLPGAHCTTRPAKGVPT